MMHEAAFPYADILAMSHGACAKNAFLACCSLPSVDVIIRTSGFTFVPSTPHYSRRRKFI